MNILHSFITFDCNFQSKFKDSSTYLARHNQCLAKAVILIKNYLNYMFTNTAEQISNMKDAPKSGKTKPTVKE